MSEFRHFDMRTDGRDISGIGVRYGDVAVLPFGKEEFETRAFGDVSALDVIMNVQHDRRRPLARTHGGGLHITDSAERLRVAATLPGTREADDALELMRTGILRGLSLEFARAVSRIKAGGIRSIKSAMLRGVGLVDRPAYPDSLVSVRSEIRQDGDGLSGSFFYDVDTVISDRAAQRAAQGGFSRLPIGGMTPDGLETRQGESVRKRRIKPGAFEFALQDDTREISLILGDYSRPLGSRLAGTLQLEDTAQSLNFNVDRLPGTSYVSDFRAVQADGAAVFGIVPFYRIPPSDVVDNPTEIIPEPGNDGVGIEVVKKAVLTALAVMYRPPVGNPGIVERREQPISRRRRQWL